MVGEQSPVQRPLLASGRAGGGPDQLGAEGGLPGAGAPDDQGAAGLAGRPLLQAVGQLREHPFPAVEPLPLQRRASHLLLPKHTFSFNLNRPGIPFANRNIWFRGSFQYCHNSKNITPLETSKLIIYFYGTFFEFFIFDQFLTLFLT